MMSETRDVLESREVSDLLSNCTSVGVSCVLDQLAEPITSMSEKSSGEHFIHPNHAAVYVAKLIPILNNLIHSDAWLQQLLKIEPLRTFGANIYESFSA